MIITKNGQTITDGTERKKRMKHKLIAMGLAACIATVLALGRPTPAFGGEWCLIGLAWVIMQVKEDLEG